MSSWAFTGARVVFMVSFPRQIVFGHFLDRFWLRERASPRIFELAGGIEVEEGFCQMSTQDFGKEGRNGVADLTPRLIVCLLYTSPSPRD